MRLYTNNPRQISRKEFEQLKRDLADLGDLGGLVHDLNTDQVISGNQRSRVFDLSKLQPVITQSFDPPTPQGTVALGYVEWQGERFSYRAVRWDDATARRANIRANMAGGSWDWGILANAWEPAELQEWGFDSDMLQGWKGDIAALGNLLESEAPEPQIKLCEQWMIVVECSSEQHQTQLLEQFMSEGLKCRALVS